MQIKWSQLYQFFLQHTVVLYTVDLGQTDFQFAAISLLILIEIYASQTHYITLLY